MFYSTTARNLPHKKRSQQEDCGGDLKTFRVKKNVLFVDPLTKLIKPQSQLNLLAIQEVMQDA
ncbi:MAG: hypothetical protein EF813_07225 [Methanosarcinales archaeon]|nr:MAG: hypothetical protein EF813_07225 [Methanosarcinales archaeon]